MIWLIQTTYYLGLYFEYGLSCLISRFNTTQGDCRVHKPGVLYGPTSQQRLSPADDVANDAQLLGRPKYLTTGRKSGPVSDRKARPRRGRRSLPTPTHFSDRKARPRRGRRSLPTPTRFSDRGYTEPLLTALLRPARSEPTGKRPNRDARSVRTQRISRSKKDGTLKSTAIPRTVPYTPVGQYYQVTSEGYFIIFYTCQKHE